MENVTVQLTYRERYDIWFKNNFETGMEYNLDSIPDFDDGYYIPTPTTKTISLSDEDSELYSDIEYLIIHWNIDGTKTAGELARKIIGLIDYKRQGKKK